MRSRDAQHLVVSAGADYYLRFADREALLRDAAVNVEGFDLLAPIIERWNAQFYARSEIATSDRKYLKETARRYRLAEDELAGQALPWRLDAAIFESIEGRAFDYRYTEGWPAAVEDKLRAKGIHY